MSDFRTIYFVVENIDSGDIHYIFKKNHLRLRISDTKDPDCKFLSFVLRDGEKIGFYIRNTEASKLRHGLPNADKIYAVNPKHDILVEDK